MSIFEPNKLLEEKVFTPSNLDVDCDSIAHFLEYYNEDFIVPALKSGRYALAVERYLQVLDSLSTHFIEDEHWNYFDDLYSPDYAVSHIWDEFIPYIRSGALAGDDLATLESGLLKIEGSEAYTEYGCPSMIPFKDLKDAKTFHERTSAAAKAFFKSMDLQLGKSE